MINKKSIDEFSNFGILKFKIDINKLTEINNKVIKLIESKKELLNKNNNINIKLEKFHENIKVKNLNEIRMYLYTNLNKNEWILKKILEIFDEYVDLIVGNELAVQKKVNLSIQLPNDNSSILPMHSDFFSGESIYQLNLWLPLVEVNKTSTMFYFLPKDSIKMISEIKKNSLSDINIIFKKYYKKIKWLNMKKGEGAIFSPNLLHGNILNKEKNTRFSLNLRVKNLYSPYNNIYGNEKKLGNFYKPMNTKALTLFNLHNSFSID